MAKRNLSPKNNQRLSIFEHYRGRGRQNNNLFLAFSVKTNKDVILASDRELIYWIYYLETNRDVKSFTLNPEIVPTIYTGNPCTEKMDAEVFFRNGEHEFHIVKGEKNSNIKKTIVSSIDTPDTFSTSFELREFTDCDLSPYVKESLRWLKAISFASALRNNSCTYEKTKLLGTMEDMQQGYIGEIINTLHQ